MAGHQAELSRLFETLGIASGPSSLLSASVHALERHGDLARGLDSIDMVSSTSAQIHLDVAAPEACLHAEGPSLTELERSLRSLGPWRKGPFALSRPGGGTLLLDAEWRSDRKWQRVQELGMSWTGKRVLDVGTGNGYFLLRLRGAGAAEVTGLEPSLRSVLQFAAIMRLFGRPECALWPLRLEELPPSLPRHDVVMSMGVLYHQRDPVLHLLQLRESLLPAGELVLETIVMPGPDSLRIATGERYAGMRNVYTLPTREALTSWLDQAGFEIREVGPAVVVTGDEQRATSWSNGPSLEQFLEPWEGDPNDPRRKTCEGHTRPARVVVFARAREGRP